MSLGTCLGEAFSVLASKIFSIHKPSQRPTYRAFLANNVEYMDPYLLLDLAALGLNYGSRDYFFREKIIDVLV